MPVTINSDVMTSKTSNLVFRGLQIVAWIIFVGLSIEAGGLIVNAIVSIYRPEFIQNLYQKLDLSTMYNDNKSGFFLVYSFILSIAILKAHLFYIVVSLMQRLDLRKPFNTFAARQIMRLSYFTLSIGFLSYLAKKVTLQSAVSEQLNPFWEDGQAFILMGAVIFIIAIIFKKGVDIQNESDLTV